MESGGRGYTYRIRKVNRSTDFAAFKVFRLKAQDPRIATIAQNLSRFADMPGLKVCKRFVIQSITDCPQLLASPELKFAVLMPWITGTTWLNIVGEKKELAPSDCLRLALWTADILARMEEKGLAHCDIASGNIIFDIDRKEVQLVDVEDIFAPDLPSPKVLPSGSPGYRHKSIKNGLWSPIADRFSGAVLLSEMLGWHDKSVRELSGKDTYFPRDESGNNSQRFQALVLGIENSSSSELAELFRQAWFSHTLDECPRLNDWATALHILVDRNKPKILLAPKEIDFGIIAPEPTYRTFQISNPSRSHLVLDIYPQSDWIRVIEKRVPLATGDSVTINVSASSNRSSMSGDILVSYFQIDSGTEPIDSVTATATLPFSKEPASVNYIGLIAAILLIILCIISIVFVSSLVRSFLDSFGTATLEATLQQTAQLLTPIPSGTLPQSTGGPQSTSIVPSIQPTGILQSNTIDHTPIALPTLPINTPVPRGIVNTKTLNLRTGPGTEYDVQEKLDSGIEFIAFSRSPSSEWLEVMVPARNDIRGWVSTELVILDFSLDNLPVNYKVPPTPTPMPTPVATPSPKPLAQRLKNVESQLCLAVITNPDRNGAAVVQNNCNGPNNQWRFVPLNGDYMQIVAEHSNMCLDIDGNSAENDGLIQRPCDAGRDTQLWRQEVKENSFRIRGKHLDLCADVPGFNKNELIQIIYYECKPDSERQTNQLWVTE